MPTSKSNYRKGARSIFKQLPNTTAFYEEVKANGPHGPAEAADEVLAWRSGNAVTVTVGDVLSSAATDAGNQISAATPGILSSAATDAGNQITAATPGVIDTAYGSPVTPTATTVFPARNGSTAASSTLSAISAGVAALAALQNAPTDQNVGVLVRSGDNVIRIIPLDDFLSYQSNQVTLYQGHEDLLLLIKSNNVPINPVALVEGPGSGVSINYIRQLEEGALLSLSCSRDASGTVVVTLYTNAGPATFAAHVIEHAEELEPYARSSGDGSAPVVYVSSGIWIRSDNLVPDSSNPPGISNAIAFGGNSNTTDEIIGVLKFPFPDLEGKRIYRAVLTVTTTTPVAGASPIDGTVYLQRASSATTPPVTDMDGTDPDNPINWDYVSSTVAISAALETKELDVTDMLRDLESSGLVSSGATTINFVFRRNESTDDQSVIQTTGTELALWITDIEDDAFRREMPNAATGTILHSVSALPYFDLFVPRLIRFRNGGTQNQYGASYIEALDSFPAQFPSAIVENGKNFLSIPRFTEFSDDEYVALPGDSGAAFLKNFWGDGVSYLPEFPEFNLSGFRANLAAKSYFQVVTGSGYQRGFLYDVFATNPFNTWNITFQPDNGITARLQVEGTSPSPFNVPLESINNLPDPNSIVTLACWWNHATKFLHVWLKVDGNSAEEFTADYSALTPLSSFQWVGFGFGLDKTSFAGSIEFANGVPADLIDNLEEIHSRCGGPETGWPREWRRGLVG